MTEFEITFEGQIWKRTKLTRAIKKKIWFILGFFELYTIQDTTKELEKQTVLLMSPAITHFVKGNII